MGATRFYVFSMFFSNLHIFSTQVWYHVVGVTFTEHMFDFSFQVCGFFVNHLTEHMFDISNLHNFSIFDGAAARSPIRDFSVNPRPIRHTQIFPETAAQNSIRDYLKILHLTKTQFCAIIKVTVIFFYFFLNKKTRHTGMKSVTGLSCGFYNASHTLYPIKVWL